MLLFHIVWHVHMRLTSAGSTDVLRDAPGEDPSVPPSPEPAYDMEALKEALEAAQTSTTISTGHSSGTSARSGSNSSVNYIGGMNRGFAASVYDAQDLSGSDGVREGDVRRGGSDFIQQGDEPVAVQQSGMAVDHWGTTRESGAEIARRLAEANEQGERCLLSMIMMHTCIEVQWPAWERCFSAASMQTSRRRSPRSNSKLRRDCHVHLRTFLSTSGNTLTVYERYTVSCAGAYTLQIPFFHLLASLPACSRAYRHRPPGSLLSIFLSLRQQR